MKKPMTQEERFVQMIETPVSTLIPRLAVPTIISMLVTSIYNMADTFFVSQIGTSASGAVGVMFSAMAMIQAIGFTLGMGSGNYISRSLGDRNGGEADKSAATAFFTALIIGILITIVGLTFLRPLVFLLGATETIAPYAMDYGIYILIAAPFMMSSFVMNNILRAQGNAMYSMIGITAGGILNMILDPVLIFGFHMGIAGAAVATMVSQMISFGILLYQCNFREGSIRLRLANFTPTWTMYGEILHAGLPSFCRQGLASVATVILNFAAGPFGDSAIAAMSIVSRFMMFINSALIGFGQSFQPVCGFNFGAKRYDRVLEAFWFCVKVAAVFLLVIGALGFAFAPQLIALLRDDPGVIAIGTVALRFQCVTFFFQAWITMSNMMLQTIGRTRPATVLAMGRQGLFFLPFILVLPGFLGMLGVQMAQPLADLLTFVIAVPIQLHVLRQMSRLPEAEHL